MAEALRDRDRPEVGPKTPAADFPPSRRRLAIFCIFVFLATVWPIYPLFSRVHPLVLGIPFSLFYLVVILVLMFSVMLGFYRWEDRNDRLD